MNKNIKLVVADIDMTLQCGMGEIFPDINRKAIQDLHDNGYLFGLATGRSTSQIINRFQTWGYDFDVDLGIGVNGSVMYDGIDKKEYKYLLLQPEWLTEVLDVLYEHDVNFYMYIDDYTVFRSPDDNYYRDVYLKNGRPARIAKDRDDFLHGEIYKGLVQVDTPEYRDFIFEILNPVMEKLKGKVKLLMTTKQCIEFVHYDTSKAYSLQKFCELHNIDPSEVAAFGDADNDNEMIAMSGMGVCLRDGVEKTKQLAKYITDLDCIDGGFGDFVYKHILND